MQLHIMKTGLLSDIQKEFSEYFPYLKIDFFRFPHTDKKLSPKDEKIDPAIPVDSLEIGGKDKILEINEKMTVGQFEAKIDYETGLFVQVSRKSGRVWLETSYTDNWTLEQQNEQGRMMSIIHEVPSEKQIEWDDWDNQ